MKKQISALLLMMVMMVPVGTATASDHNGVVSAGIGVVKLPFKLVGGVVGGIVGALSGGVQGVMSTWSSVNKEHATHPLLVLPVGVVSLVYAVPVGLATGAPGGAIETGKAGFNWL